MILMATNAAPRPRDDGAGAQAHQVMLSIARNFAPQLSTP